MVYHTLNIMIIITISLNQIILIDNCSLSAQVLTQLRMAWEQGYCDLNVEKGANTKELILTAAKLGYRIIAVNTNIDQKDYIVKKKKGMIWYG